MQFADWLMAVWWEGEESEEKWAFKPKRLEAVIASLITVSGTCVVPSERLTEAKKIHP